MLRRGGRFSGGSRFQRQRDSGSAACVVCAIIDILGNVGEVAADASLVARLDIELFSALRTNKSPNHLSYHHQSRFSRFQGLMVILRSVTWVLITIRVI